MSSISKLWAENNKVHFAIITFEDKQYLICHSNVANAIIRYVEDLQSGKRRFPTQEQKQSASSQEDLIETLIKSF